MDKKVLIEKYYEFVKEHYDFNNMEVQAKFRHSVSVAYLMEKYASIIGANPELAFKIGLLHDIGRYHQIIEYKTYNDQQSLDHGEYGVRLLNSYDLYKNFGIVPSNISLVDNAIYNHNKYRIEREPVPGEGVLQTKLLRDCDKLAILDQYVKVPIHEIAEEVTKEDRINPVILEGMKNHVLNKFENVKNGLDEICYYISYVFDMNFKETYEEVLSYVNIILDWYRSDARFDIVKEYIDSYNLERKKSYVRH